jgi:hypothetical protein
LTLSGLYKGGKTGRSEFFILCLNTSLIISFEIKMALIPDLREVFYVIIFVPPAGSNMQTLFLAGPQ